MKMKLWQWEWDFDKEDAKIIVPLVLLVFGLAWAQVRKELLLGVAAGYYLLYFFLMPVLLSIKKVLELAYQGIMRWMRFRCAHCRSKDIFLQGYDTFRSDEHYPYYLCPECGMTSIMLRENKLIKASINAPGIGTA